MNENELNELIVIEQLPKITQQLQLISSEIDKEIEYALSLECSEESKNEVKKAKANLNKIKTTLEERRKQVKNAVMNPYTEFENIYNELVKDKLVNADTTLKNRIDEIENQEKLDKENELREFAEQHIIANNIQDIVTFEDIGLNITLSASIKSLKEQVLEFVDKVVSDMKLIEMEEYRDEIFVEYIKNHGNFAQCKMNVIERHRKIEELKKQQEEKLEQEKQEEKIVEKVEEVIAPKEIIEDDEIIKVSFTLTGTKEQIKKVKDLIIELGIEYE